MHTCTHIHAVDYYTAIKRDVIMPFEMPSMDLEDITLSEISQPAKDTYHMIPLASGIFFKKWLNEQKTESDQ